MMRDITAFPPVRAAALAVAALIALALLSGCTPVGVAVGAGAMAGSAALEERGLEQAVRDEADEIGISKRLADYRFDTFRRVNVDVYEGRALLTGIVPEPDDRVEAVRIAWATGGIVDVVNEVLIGEGVGAIDTTADVRITSELRAKITFDADVKAVNYNLQAVGGTLYLFGVAQSPAEIARVEAHARTIPNVRRIVSHMLLKEGDRRASLLEALEAELAKPNAGDGVEEGADKGAGDGADAPEPAS